MTRITQNVVTFLLYIFALNIAAQSTPHLEGTVFIDMDSGIFKCDVTVSNIDTLQEYAILLNKGMNIKHFRDRKDKLISYDGFYGAELKGEAIPYFFTDSKRNKIALPTDFKVSYVGAFPKYSDSYNSFDFKGFIALNDQTIRATEQTKWYPVIYDKAKDKLINQYTYSLQIHVKGAKSIFINGAPPKRTSNALFTSSKAVPLFLFAGDYKFVHKDGNYILNTDISEKKAGPIFRNTKVVQQFLEDKLDRTFTDNIYLINHKAVNKRRKGSSWGFNTYPAFAFTGENFFTTIVEEDGKFSNGRFRYFAHEFGHNYFGNNVQSGKLYWFWLESFPEYLSFTFAEEHGGKDYLKRVIQSKIKAVKDKEFVPLSKITEANQITGNYRYSMAPLILFSFDQHFGRSTTYEVLKKLLDMATTETLSLLHFKKAALASGVKESEYTAFENKYIKSAEFTQNVISYLEGKL